MDHLEVLDKGVCNVCLFVHLVRKIVVISYYFDRFSAFGNPQMMTHFMNE